MSCPILYHVRPFPACLVLEKKTRELRTRQARPSLRLVTLHNASCTLHLFGGRQEVCREAYYSFGERSRHLDQGVQHKEGVFVLSGLGMVALYKAIPFLILTYVPDGKPVPCRIGLYTRIFRWLTVFNEC